MDRLSKRKIDFLCKQVRGLVPEGDDLLRVKLNKHLAQVEDVELTKSSHLDQYLQSICKSRDAKLAFNSESSFHKWRQDVSTLAVPDLVEHLKSQTS